MSDPVGARSCCSREALALLRLPGPGGPGSPRDPADAFQHCDPERLLELAVREGALAPLARALEGPAGEAVAPPIRRRAARLAAVYGHRQVQLREGLEEALAVLAARDVEVLLLKGAALVGTVYEDVGERPMSDLDLLVRPSDAEAAHRALEGAGWRWDRAAYPRGAYADHHHLPPLSHPGRAGIELELHRFVFPPGHPFDVTSAGFWSSRQSAPSLGPYVGRPDLPHLTLHLCVHFVWSNRLARDGWRSLRDARALASEMDPEAWEAFLLLAGEARAASCAYWTLRLARSLVDAPVPRGLLARLAPELAAPLLDALERHHASVLFGRSGCPSLRLQRWLWMLAVRPVASGHGDVRPWTGVGQVRLPNRRAGGTAATTEPPSRQLRAAAHRLRHWVRWARGVAGGPPPRAVW